MIAHARGAVIAVVVAAAAAACTARTDAPAPASARPARPAPRPDRPPGAPADAAAPAPLVAPARLPGDVVPLAYALRLELDPDADTFRGDVTIRVRIVAATARVWLHAGDLELAAAEVVDGAGTAALAPLATTGGTLRAFALPAPVAAGRELALHFAYRGRTTRDQEGVFRQRARDRAYLFTQAEPAFAREIVPCFDEPRFKVPWSVTLIVPKAMVALANAPQIEERARDDGRRELVFAETPAMASYLLAVAVGPFTLVDAGVVGRRAVHVRIAAQAGEAAQLGVVGGRLPAIVAAMERYLDDALPLAKLDLVSVPHLFGAMEHPGLVTFASSVLLGDPKHAAHVDNFVRIAAHEIAHQWFGNLVTPAWWDDLWLSEAFASWLGEKIADDVLAADPAIRIAHARTAALAADNAPGTRPLRRAVVRGDDAEVAFDAIAYEKGEAVLATFERTIGAAALQRALRGYLHDHAGGTATMADVVGAFAAASSADVGRAFVSYLERAGAPIVELALRCDRGSPVVEARARGGYVVPVCVRYATPRGSARACALVDDRAELAIVDARTCPRWLVGNDGGLAYYQVAWASGGALGALPAIATLAPAERIAVADDAAAAIVRGEVAVADALAIIERLARARDARDAAAQPSARVAAALARAIDPLIDDATRPAWQGWLAARLPATLQATPYVIELAGTERLPAATIRQARARLDAALARPRAASDLVAEAAIAAPSGGTALFERVVARLHTTVDHDARDALVDALGWFGVDQLERAIELVADADLGPVSGWSVVATYFDRAPTRTAAWAAVRPRIAALVRRLGPDDASELVTATAALCEPVRRAEVAAAFAPVLADITDGRRLLDRALAAIDRCIARRAAAGDIATALARAR